MIKFGSDQISFCVESADLSRLKWKLVARSDFESYSIFYYQHRSTPLLPFPPSTLLNAPIDVAEMWCAAIGRRDAGVSIAMNTRLEQSNQIGCWALKQ